MKRFVIEFSLGQQEVKKLDIVGTSDTIEGINELFKKHVRGELYERLTTLRTEIGPITTTSNSKSAQYKRKRRDNGEYTIVNGYFTNKRGEVYEFPHGYMRSKLIFFTHDPEYDNNRKVVGMRRVDPSETERRIDAYLEYIIRGYRKGDANSKVRKFDNFKKAKPHYYIRDTSNYEITNRDQKMKRFLHNRKESGSGSGIGSSSSIGSTGSSSSSSTNNSNDNNNNNNLTPEQMKKQKRGEKKRLRQEAEQKAYQEYLKEEQKKREKFKRRMIERKKKWEAIKAKKGNKLLKF